MKLSSMTLAVLVSVVLGLHAAGGSPKPELRDVLLVGNAVSGTVTVIDTLTLEKLVEINIIPDLQERLTEIRKNPAREFLFGFLEKNMALPPLEPTGHRYVDDLFLSPDGTRLYVSRCNLGDVVAFDLSKPGFPILWRTVVKGFKADHAAISPDGKRIVVSASLATRAQVMDTETGRVVGSFKTGLLPHQNDYSKDGKHIYNTSVGALHVPYALNRLKGARELTIVDAETLKTIRVYSFEFGLRPSVLTDDESTFYVQLSYLNGLVKFDLASGKITAKSEQPLSEYAREHHPVPDKYLHDSAHHGLALSGDGKKLCDAGTIDNTVSIVASSDLSLLATIDVGMLPYWASTSPDGRYCFVSLSGANKISVIDYDEAREVATIPVGIFPQRNRIGKLRW